MKISYESTEFVNEGAPAWNATQANKMGAGIEANAEAISAMPLDQAAYTATGSTSTDYKITSYRTEAPAAGEVPLIMLIKPGITNAAMITATPSWGATAYPIYDFTTGARLTGGEMASGRPVVMIFDGSYFWINGGGGFVSTATFSNHGADHGPSGGDPIAVDASPTDGSGNPVSSNGVHDALALKTDASELTSKADLDGGVVKASQAVSLVETQIASFTLALTQAEKTILANSSSAIVVTVPLNSAVPFPIGTAFNIIRIGSGATSFSFTSGITSHVVNSVTTISAQNSSAVLVKIGTNEWWLACG